LGSLGWVTAKDAVNSAPLDANEFRYGAAGSPTMSAKEWFSSSTTTT
jgi:hypothetical protein